jgi:hypothetical protein
MANTSESFPSFAKIPAVMQVMSSETNVEKNKTRNKFFTHD